VVSLQDVLPVVDHLEIAVQRHGVHAPLEGGAEVAEERCDVEPLDVLVSPDAVGEILEVTRRDEVAHPLGVEHERVITVRPRRHVAQDLVVEVAEGNGDDVDLRPGELPEGRGAPLQRLRDLRPGERHDVDRDAVVGLRRLLATTSAPRREQ
jgi:hypothetical protein